MINRKRRTVVELVILAILVVLMSWYLFMGRKITDVDDKVIPFCTSTDNGIDVSMDYIWEIQAVRRFWRDIVSIIPVWKMCQNGLNGLACWSGQTNNRIQKLV